MDVAAITCSCGSEAVRLGAYRVAVTEPQADTRGMFRRFTEASHEIARATESEQSNDWAIAKHRAKAIDSAGETRDVLTRIRGV